VDRSPSLLFFGLTAAGRLPVTPVANEGGMRTMPAKKKAAKKKATKKKK
jgi:hypothetical protein